MAWFHDFRDVGDVSASHPLHMRYFIYCRKSSEAEDRQVLSIESQLTTLQRTFTASADIEIAHVFEESFSAKAPGRQLFSEMMKRIERGEAEGIIAWAPDRLARNSIDGGQIVYLLDRGVIKDLKFATYTFENNPQGKFMLQIMFGQSKYYSDALSENVKRGNRTKLEKGWRPNVAPLGYMNDRENGTIITDPVYFPLVRRMYDLMLSGDYSPRQIATVARDDWGLRTPLKKRKGGTPLAMSAVYKLLTNPFYSGIIVWRGETFPGKHHPLCTVDEQRRINALLQPNDLPRPKTYSFPFRGLIRCGTCGLNITAEHKTNRHGHRYIYYHCTRSRVVRCSEPSIELRELERQILHFLKRITIPQKVADAIVTELQKTNDADTDMLSARQVQLDSTIMSVTRQQTELVGLRLRGLITDEEFTERRNALVVERQALVQNQRRLGDSSTFEPFEALISFRKCAVDWYLRADDARKRLILKTVASNPTLRAKKLSIQARKPFTLTWDFAEFPQLRAVVEDVRTFFMNDDEETREVIDAILKLRDHFGPVQKPKRRSRAKSPKSLSPSDQTGGHDTAF